MCTVLCGVQCTVYRAQSADLAMSRQGVSGHFLSRDFRPSTCSHFFRRLASPVSRRKRKGVFHRVSNCSSTLNRQNIFAISLKVLPRHCNSGSMYSPEFLLRTLKNQLELKRVKFPSLPPVARSRQCFPVIFTQNPRTLPSYVLILTRSIQIIMLQGRKLII